MSASEPRVSGDLVRLIRNEKSGEKLARQHAPDRNGRCPVCKSISCTIYAAATVAVALEQKALAKLIPQPRKKEAR